MASPVSNMKRQVVVVHGCCEIDEMTERNPETRTYDKHWMPWLARQLKDTEFTVITPHMPSPWLPDYEAFKSEFEKLPVTENDVLVGHSCGAAFLVRWLGETKQKVAKLILVAPWKIPDAGDQARMEFYGYEIDRSIPERVGSITIFTADDEVDDGKESVRIFHDVLGGKIIELPEHGHYTMEDMNTEEFPELVADIRSL